MQFAAPRMIRSGSGELRSVAEFAAGRALIVTDKNMMKQACVRQAADCLEGGGTEVRIFSEIDAEPRRSTVDAAVKEARAFSPDLIVCIGGGSAMDVAKAVWAFCELPGLSWEEAIVPFSLPRFSGRIRLAAVPTTSGTGSEVGTSAVVMDDGRTPPVKQWIDSYEIIPDLAVLDPEVCKSMPPQVTAGSGFDALSHAVEAYAATGACELTDCLALRAAALIFRWLPAAYSDGQDTGAREKMQLASAMAGMAFNNAGLGLMHAMAHQIGAQLRIAHGVANALVMPYVIRFNSGACADRYARLAAAAGLEGEARTVRGLIRKLQELRRGLGLPMSIREAAERAGAAGQYDPGRLVESAMRDGCAQTNPRKFTPDDVRRLYEAAYRGDDPAAG